MLLVIKPHPTKLPIVLSIVVSALTVAHVVAPITAVLIPICMGESTGAMCPVIRPLAFVLRSVGPLHFAIAVAQAADPLA